MTVRKNMCYCTFGYWMCENSAYTETFPVSICNSYKSPYKHGTTSIHSTLSLKKANPRTYCSLWAFPANPNLKKKKIKGRDKKSTPRNALPDTKKCITGSETEHLLPALLLPDWLPALPRSCSFLGGRCTTREEEQLTHSRRSLGDKQGNVLG